MCTFSVRVFCASIYFSHQRIVFLCIAICCIKQSMCFYHFNYHMCFVMRASVLRSDQQMCVKMRSAVCLCACALARMISFICFNPIISDKKKPIAEYILCVGFVDPLVTVILNNAWYSCIVSCFVFLVFLWLRHPRASSSYHNIISIDEEWEQKTHTTKPSTNYSFRSLLHLSIVCDWIQRIYYNQFILFLVLFV